MRPDGTSSPGAGDQPHQPQGESALGRARRVAVRVLALPAILAFNFMLVVVLIDAAGRAGQTQPLEPPGSPEARFGAEHPGELVHLVGGVAALAMGVGGLGGLVVRPQRAGSATQAGLAAIGWLLVSAVVGDPDNYGGQAGPVDVAFVVLTVPALCSALLAAPWRAWRGAVPRPQFLWMALAGVPWLWYGYQQGLMQRHTWPPLADPHHQAHWFVMSLAAVLIVLLAAGGSLHGRGWRVATATSGVSAIGIAVTSLLDLQAASAMRSVWAAAALLWGALVLLLTRHAGRSERLPS
ncbi:MAG TPA: hypothetical protein VM754_11585 [Actinomycetota bacterium]|nr:hypothetical protein [Actinomycetota bacterium]